jgi:L-ribulose-5-phosphate 3-epimerase
MKKTLSGTWPRLGAMAHELGVKPDEAERVVSFLQSAGMSTVQLGTPLLEEIIAHRELIAEWCARLEAASLSLHALGGYRNLVAPDKARREANIAFLQRCLEMAPQFGTTIVATETGTYNRQNDWSPAPDFQEQEVWDILCATLRELLPVAEKHGTILALEGHVNHVINTPERLARLLEQFPTPHFQVVLDPFDYLGRDQMARKEQVVANFLQQFKDRFVLAHLKDVHQEGAEVDTPAFGQRVFPASLYLDFLRRERPDRPLIIEHASLEQVPEVLWQVRHLEKRLSAGQRGLKDPPEMAL